MTDRIVSQESLHDRGPRDRLLAPEDDRDAVIGQCHLSNLNSRPEPDCGHNAGTRLRLAVFRRLLACMAAPKPCISLSAVSLATGAPELGTPDPTELRTLIRAIP